MCIFAFDLIYLNGEPLTDKSLRERREYLYKYFPHVESKLMFAVNMNSNDVEAIQGFLDQSIKGLHLNTNNIKTDTNKKSNFQWKISKDLVYYIRY